MNILTFGPVSVDSGKLKTLCDKWGIRSISIFGSVLSGDFNIDSDLDFLIEYVPGIRRSLFDYDPMREDFAALFGREVDLVNAAGLRESRNYIRRDQIFSTARPFYAGHS